MIVSAAPSRARWAGRLRLGVLTLVALLAAHTAIFAVEYGLGDDFARAMAAGGHDGWWAPASAAVLIVGTLLLLQTLGTLRGLERRARPLTTDAQATPSFGGELFAIWRRLFPLVTVLFAVQENGEHLSAEGHLLWLDALGGSGYPLAVPALALVTLGLAALGALVRWRIATLRSRLARAAQTTRRRPARSILPWAWRITGALAPLRWMLDRPDAGRSPPRNLPA